MLLRRGALDLDTLFWSPRNRPTPFIGYAPQNGVQFGRHFNFQQLNMAGELPLPKPAGEYRVFLTGASVALGGGAPTDESTIAGVMQKNLAPEYAARGRQARIVCGAACGWSSTQERLLIENRLSEWEPDAVIQLTGFNDMHWGFNKFSTLDGRSYDDHNFLLLINGGLALAGEPEYSDVPPIRPEVPVDPDLIAQRFVKNIRLAAQALALRNTPLIVGLQPILAPEFKPLSPGEQALYAQAGEPLQAHVEACYQRFRARLYGADGALLPELAQAHPNLRVIDLRGLYAQRPEPYFLDLVHQGTRGNVVIAEALGAELMKLATSTLPLEQAP